MRTRTRLALVSLALVTAACGAEAGTVADGVVLRYAFQPGHEVTYELIEEFSMEMIGTGDFGIPGGLDMTMDMDVVGEVAYSFEEGPEPDTIRLAATTEILDGRGSVEMLGTTQRIPFGEIAQGFGAAEFEMVVNARGEIVEIVVGGQALPPGLLENLGGMTGSAGYGQIGPGQLVGPPFPATPVAVGSTWTTEIDSSVLGIDIRSVSEHRVTGTEEISGRTTYRIETETITEAIDFDLADLVEMITENADWIGEMSGDDVSAAQLEAGLAMFANSGMEMTYHMARSVARSTVWFDADRGIVVIMKQSTPQSMRMEMRNIPESGDVAMDMTMTAEITFRLVD